MNSSKFKLNTFTIAILLTGNSFAANTTLVSSVSGTSVNATSQQPSISYNGQFVTFTSKSGALIGAPSDTQQHVYVKDLINNTSVRASETNNGSIIGNNRSYNPKISGDGRYVVYRTRATNLGGTVSTDNNGTHDIYRYDTQTGNSTLVSNAFGTTTTSDGRSAEQTISEDGRYIAFSSKATNLVSPSTAGRQIFVKDMVTGDTNIVSVISNTQTASTNDSFEPAISGNGQFIVFSSIASNLDTNDTNGTYDIYLHDRLNNTTKRISLAIDNKGLSTALSYGTSSNPSISDDGEIIVYSSSADNLVKGDINGLIDAFIYDSITQETTRITTTSNGPNGASIYPHVSGNGRLVTFSSTADSLSIDKNSDNSDLFVYDRILKTVTLASVDNNNVSTGSNIGKVFATNYDGTSNVFSTAGKLTSGDTNTKIDVYLRKIDQPINSKPIAKAANVPSEACVNGGAYVTFDASNSTDADKEDLTYSWSGNFGSVSGEVVDVFLDAGIHNVILTVTDSRGDSSTESFSVNITDTTDPVINAEAPVTIEATSINGAPHIASYTVSDNCLVASISETPSFSVYPLGPTDIEITVTDSLGNSSSDLTSVTVEDTTKPVITLPANITKEASAIRTPVSIVNATAYDIFPVTMTSNALSDYPLGPNKITWTATDSNTNFATAEQSVTIVDTTDPALSIPSDKTVEALAPTMAVDIGNAEASDIFLVGVTNNSPTIFPMGSTSVLWTANDSSGNETTATQTIQVLDTIPPVLTSDTSIILEATAKEGAEYAIQYSATDACINCGAISYTFDPLLDFYPLGETIVKLTASDSSDNATSNDVTITVQDTTPPTLDIPADINTEATDILSIIDIHSASGDDIFTPVRIDNDAPDAFPLGTTDVTWSATDDNGKVSTEIQHITVVDTTAPGLTIPANVIKEAQARLTNVSIGEASATDIFNFAISNEAPSNYALGDTLVTWIALDVNGNQSSADQTITIVDTTPPAVSAGNDITLEATNLAGAPFTLAYQASDICDCGDLSINITPLQANYALGESTIKITATDISGNSASDTMRLTVVDTTQPILQLPANIIMEATGQLTPVSVGNATANDIFNVSIVNNAPAVFPLGDSQVIWTATDVNGNVTTAIQIVTIIDTTPPAFTLDIEKDSLWPANHKMVHVANVENVSDLVDENPVVNIEISSNADHQRKKHKSDWKIVESEDVWKIYLRAEKSRHAKEDRVYTIDVTVSDFTGNQSVQTSEVIVPHKHRKHKKHDENDHKRDKKEHKKSKHEDKDNKKHKRDDD